MLKRKNYLMSKAFEATIIFIVFILLFVFKLNANPAPLAIFSDGMVVQRNHQIPVWGLAAPGAYVDIEFNTQKIKTIASESGKWKILFPPMKAGGPFEMIIKSETFSDTISDIYIGDVWFVSGQSNMEMELNQTKNADYEIKNANFPHIREFKIPKSLSNEPSDSLPASSTWLSATPENAGNFSAVAYYFAKNLSRSVDVPIGIINSSYGGSRIEAWMSKEMLGYDEQDVVLAGRDYEERQPTVAFNKMIYPLAGLPVKGFLWYQGESNADNEDDALQYGQLFKKMIVGWRNLWNMGNLPFYWVQLPNYGQVYPEPQEYKPWPWLRYNQSKALTLPKTGEVVTIDLGEVDIHPKNKKPVGERLTNLVLEKTYLQQTDCENPVVKKAEFLDDNRILVTFNTFNIPLSNKTGTTDGFAITNKNGKTIWAKASINSDSTVIVSHNTNIPQTVQYAWENNPANAGLFNQAGLPAAPFKLYIENGLSIKQFRSSSNKTERGESVLLTWVTSGAENVKLNGTKVDNISGKRVLPEKTTKYTLEIVNTKGKRKQQTINVTVVEPMPKISLSINTPGIIAPGKNVEISANTAPPRGAKVESVEILINKKKVKYIEKPPYKYTWQAPQAKGVYTITASVIDNIGNKVLSKPISVEVSPLETHYYEAENAEIKGQFTIKENTNANNGQYVDFQNEWSLVFNEVEAPEEGIYPVTIRYMMNYGGPKGQLLFVNSSSIGEINFTAPDTKTWMNYNMEVDLEGGKNTIVIEKSWGWMSIDYISIGIKK
ncbi:MAG: hypothetical protein PF486_07570 [Prolixibacteraceae bacterium]|jgi:sialate O-acetylesterase|nr:hypothetical protein [Prolixibacteraceae bacterium]